MRCARCHACMDTRPQDYCWARRKETKGGWWVRLIPAHLSSPLRQPRSHPLVGGALCLPLPLYSRCCAFALIAVRLRSRLGRACLRLPQVISRSLCLWPVATRRFAAVFGSSYGTGSKDGAEFTSGQFSDFDHPGSWSRSERKFSAQRILET